MNRIMFGKISGGKKNSVGKLLGIILAVVFVVVVASVILYVWNMRKKRRYQKTKLNPQQRSKYPVHSRMKLVLCWVQKKYEVSSL
jgi:flagellar basal body-associated protein FliL